jgi:catechol 2,3-dioxygenase-like lactoylglutathione lyase family enzyme
MEPARMTRDVILRPADPDAAVRFYEETLGFRVFERGPHLVGLEAGGVRLFIERGAAHGPVFEILVADVDAARAELIARGCVVALDEPEFPRLYLRDPHGLVFNVARRTDL